ncbi:MAG: PorP/SprF family type IX secretion system membrane protein [Chitinophagales bacterium]
MKKLRNIFFTLSAILIADSLAAQDPSFSQFFSSPLNVNPALTGNVNGKWRVMSNLRKQWITPATPYTTGTISADSKIFQNMPANEMDEKFRIGVGGMMMFDEAMAGALKSNYASFNVSGNIRLGSGYDYASNSEAAEHRFGVGLGIIYGDKRIDQSKLNFEDQFTGRGFDTNLPTGESGLSNMKPYLSTSAGVLYSYLSTNTVFELGAAAFHFNKPKQTFLDDPNQFLATRYVVHANFETFLTQQVFLNSNAVYQSQSGASYFSIGGALGYYVLTSDEKDMVLNAGCWYWSNNAVIPYFGFSYGNYQIGLTYDITASKLTQSARKAPTFELCLVVRGGDKPEGAFPAPWK